MVRRFEIGDVIIIINPKHKYYGERGRVKKITEKMVYIRMKGTFREKGFHGNNPVFRIMKESVRRGPSPYPIK